MSSDTTRTPTNPTAGGPAMYYLSRGMIVLLFVAFTLGIWMRGGEQSSHGAKTAGTAIARADESADSEPKSESSDDKDAEPAKEEDKKEESAKESEADKEESREGDASQEKADDKQEKADKDAEKKTDADKAKTYTVKEESLHVVVALDGVVESKRNTEVMVDPKTWSDWIVESAVEQGTQVKKGDKLVQFDTIRIDEEIRDEQAARKLAELSLQQTAAEIRLLEQSMPVELQIAERANRLAQADLDLFLKEDRDLQRRMADFQIKLIGNQLEYQREELKQLEKMYKADDLTEETEEIILKRTRDEVEQYEFMNEIAAIRRDRLVKIELPREEDQLKEAVNERALSLQKAQTTLPIQLDKLRLELEKQKFEREKAAEKLERLDHDRKLMTVAAPADGLVYYGAPEQGEWKQAASMANKLRKGGRISPDEVFLTIVDPDNLTVRATVPEKELWQIRRGMTGAALLTGYGPQRLPASIDWLSTTPAPTGAFLATVLVDWNRLSKDLSSPAPGMECKVKITTYSKDKVLTLPAKAVHTDAQKDDKRYVWLQPAEGKPVRRNVTVGRTMEDRIEVVDGLAAGDKVLREEPEDEE